MRLEELETIIEGATETQNLDFKGNCAWDAQSMAKDVLAMTNTQDGGMIVIGVKEEDDGSYSKEGVDETNIATYKRDNMLDQLAKYADPHVTFSVETVADEEKKSYVVIKIFPFQEVPVICRKDGSGLQAGVIYHRNRNQKPESARVSNSYDMRDIIERAAIKMMQRARSVGYEVPDKEQAVNEALAKERGDL